jgi:cell division protein FtsB
MINIIKKNNKNFFFIKSIFIRTSLVFIFAYFAFHFLNGNISLSPLADKKQLLEESTQVLLKKEKILLIKELMISRLSNSKENTDLLDELVRLKLGYSGSNEIIISNK